MNEEQFWSIVEESRCAIDTDIRDGNMELQKRRLESLLRDRRPAEVLAFRDIFQALMARSWDFDLLGIAYILGKGCGDDHFDSFRAWLISMGRSAYETALASPESVEPMASAPGVEDIFFEEFMYVPGQVYAQATGKEAPNPDAPKAACSGRPWQSESELEQRFPDLYRRHLG